MWRAAARRVAGRLGRSGVSVADGWCCLRHCSTADRFPSDGWLRNPGRTVLTLLPHAGEGSSPTGANGRYARLTHPLPRSRTRSEETRAARVRPTVGRAGVRCHRAPPQAAKQSPHPNESSRAAAAGRSHPPAPTSHRAPPQPVEVIPSPPAPLPHAERGDPRRARARPTVGRAGVCAVIARPAQPVEAIPSPQRVIARRRSRSKQSPHPAPSEFTSGARVCAERAYMALGCANVYLSLTPLMRPSVPRATSRPPCSPARRLRYAPHRQ
jgi:hypothetical protein